jgi:hypothetical protein
VVVNSATEIVATWITGVPPTTTHSPLLSFSNSTDSESVSTKQVVPPSEQGAPYYKTYKRLRHFAYGPQVVNNSLSVSGSSANVACSYAGGCDYEVFAPGLSSLLKGNQTVNKVKICDEECVFDESSSTSSTAKCKLPKLSTTYSD